MIWHQQQATLSRSNILIKLIVATGNENETSRYLEKKKITLAFDYADTQSSA